MPVEIEAQDFEIEFISDEEFFAEPNIFHFFPFYELPFLNKTNAVGLYGEKCIIQPKYSSKFISITFEDKIYAGDKSSVYGESDIEIPADLEQIILNKSNYVFYACLDNEEQIRIFDLFNKYSRKIEDALGFDDLELYWPDLLLKANFNIRQIYDIFHNDYEILIARFPMHDYTCKILLEDFNGF